MRRLLAADGDAVTPADDAFRRRPGSAACARRSFAAGQSLVLVRLAADCGARRGELAVLRRLSDLDGRVLTIERSLSAGFPGPVKSGRTRRVILGSGTADMIRRHFRAMAARPEPEQDWLFSPSPQRSAPDSRNPFPSAHPPGEGRWCRACGLHCLRHGVATSLAGQGRLLKAQAASATAIPPPRCGTSPTPPRSTTPT